MFTPVLCSTRPRRRAVYRAAPHSLRIRVKAGRAEEAGRVEDDGSSGEEEEWSSPSAAGLSSRDLSPVQLVREYLTDCTGEMVEDMERIYAKMTDAADRGAAAVRRTAGAGVETAARVADRGAMVVKAASEVGSILFVPCR